MDRQEADTLLAVAASASAVQVAYQGVSKTVDPVEDWILAGAAPNTNSCLLQTPSGSSARSEILRPGPLNPVSLHPHHGTRISRASSRLPTLHRKR